MYIDNIEHWLLKCKLPFIEDCNERMQVMQAYQKERKPIIIPDAEKVLAF